MKKRLAGLLLLAALGGCATSQPGSFMSNVGPMGAPAGGIGGCSNGACVARGVPGVVGPTGEPVPMRAPGGPQTDESLARNAALKTFSQSLPPDVVAQVAYKENGGAGGIIRAGMPAGGMMPGGPMPGGPMPGGGGGGLVPPVGSGLPGAVAAVGALTGPEGTPFPAARTSVRFAGPNGMKVAWFAPTADGKAGFSPTSLSVPGRYNFPQANFYRLKLAEIAGFPGLELYPTLEVVPGNARTATFLAHSSVPLTITREDVEQVIAGNYLVKVIYLPYPQFQDLAVAAPGEVVSSRLEPGADPIQEALARGSILLVVRMGNIDLEAPGTPAMDAPSPFMKQAMTPPAGMPGIMPSPGSPIPQARGPVPPGMMQGPGGPMMMPGVMPGMPTMPGMGAGMPGMPGMAPGMPGMIPAPGQLPPGMPTSAPKMPSSSAKPVPSGVVPVVYKAPEYDQSKDTLPKKTSRSR